MELKIIGVDPDAAKHGIAIYENCQLTELAMLTTMQIYRRFKDDPTVLLFSIENVLKKKMLYKRNRKSSRLVEHRVAMSVGRCQQSQVELQRAIEEMGQLHVLYLPTVGNWANNRKVFEAVTGWKGDSNSDTRSAAFFGYKALVDSGRRLKTVE